MSVECRQSSDNNVIPHGYTSQWPAYRAQRGGPVIPRHPRRLVAVCSDLKGMSTLSHRSESMLVVDRPMRAYDRPSAILLNLRCRGREPDKQALTSRLKATKSVDSVEVRVVDADVPSPVLYFRHAQCRGQHL